jgi:hypothetical protein
MITGLNIARVAKLIALFGFILPWVLVSCSGTPIAHLSGLDLATGGATIHNPSSGATSTQHGHPNIWVAACLLVVILGIVASFVLKGMQAIQAMLAAAAVALVLSIIGVSGISSDAQAEAQRQPIGGGDQTASQSLNGLLRVDLQYGYYITVAGLLAAIAACGLVLSGREGMLTRGGRPPAA